MVELVFPALTVLVGAHYMPFATLYGMRMFLFLAGVLIATGVAVAVYFAETFSLGAWIGGVILFVFGWIGRSVANNGVERESVRWKDMSPTRWSLNRPTSLAAEVPRSFRGNSDKPQP